MPAAASSRRPVAQPAGPSIRPPQATGEMGRVNEAVLARWQPAAQPSLHERGYEHLEYGHAKCELVRGVLQRIADVMLSCPGLPARETSRGGAVPFLVTKHFQDSYMPRQTRIVHCTPSRPV